MKLTRLARASTSSVPNGLLDARHARQRQE
jgi:hypothetical protein